MKEHKFFERYLNNNLDILSAELEDRYKKIYQATNYGIKPISEQDTAWMSSGSISTVKWKEYNVFQFNIDGIYNLYRSISEMVKEACEYYEINFEEQKYMMQGWFNINHSNVGKLDWHDHGEPFAPRFHGYYCVNAEPSITQYKLFNDPNRIVDNVNKNNRAIVSEMGHPHAMGDWDWSGSRITVAYDILPLKQLMQGGPEAEQHWIPLN
jgi:hypothetical protein